MDYKKRIADAALLDGVTYEDMYNLIGVCQDASMGDYALPCFKFAKTFKKSPQQIAEQIVATFEKKGVRGFLSCHAVSGYVNFRLDRQQFVNDALGLLQQKGSDFLPQKSNGKTICLDYSSVNIAKPFHIGHLMTTAIGGSLYRIFGYLGYKTVGINHLGDWGTQFGKLISAYTRWGSREKIETGGIQALNELYVRFHAEAEVTEGLDDEARGYFKQIEDGNQEALKLFEWFKEITLREVNKVYARLGVQFDSYNGESFYNDKLADVVSLLQEKSLLQESDGALVVDLEQDEMPPCLILKKDGASLYATRDLAAAMYRKKTYDFDRNLYVVAYQQNLHFKQVFRVLEKCGFDWAKDCIHVPFGMVSIEGAGALSTRKGNVIYLNDVLETAVQKTRDIIAEKNPDLAEKEETAEAVGVGAVVYFALATAKIKDVAFSYEKALNFDGETAPYIQYTHARCCSVLDKCAASDASKTADSLTDDEAFELVKLLSRYDAVVESAAEKYEPSILARYLVDVAQSFNRFYITHRIAGDPSRITLTQCTKAVLKNGLSLLLIRAPERM